MEPEIQIYQKETYLRGKMLSEVFSRPMDLFDFFLNASVRRFEIVLLHLILWLYAPACKLALNFLTLRYFQNPDVETSFKLTDGLVLSFLVYPLSFFLLYIFERYEVAFFESIGKTQRRGIIFLAFLPFSASSIFWLLPKPLNFFGIVFSLIISGKNYYEALLNLKELEKIQILKLFIIFFIFILFFSFLFLLIFGFIRNS